MNWWCYQWIVFPGQCIANFFLASRLTNQLEKAGPYFFYWPSLYSNIFFFFFFNKSCLKRQPIYCFSIDLHYKSSIGEDFTLKRKLSFFWRAFADGESAASAKCCWWKCSFWPNAFDESAVGIWPAYV